jgi:regulator of replication initiation timing
MNREELKHTEEPWYNDDMVIRQTGTNAQICEVSYDENTENPHEDIVNAKRIVECVNAFKGIEKPSEYINSLQKEIDRLKAALDFNVKENINILRQFSESIEENKRLKAENEELKKLYIELIELKGATEYPPLATIDLIRSFLNISERKGIDTNWDSYTMQCKRYIELYTLKPQINNESECLHPFDKIYQSTTECYCEQCGKDLTT